MKYIGQGTRCSIGNVIKRKLTLENVQILVLESMPELVWRHPRRRLRAGLRGGLPAGHIRREITDCFGDLCPDDSTKMC